MDPEERLNRTEEEERLRHELEEARDALQRACQKASTNDRAAALERYTLTLRNLSDFLLKR